VEAVVYLNTHLEDDERDAEELFLLALRDVARAHGFKHVASRAKLGRESLYKALSPSGNPTLGTLIPLLRVLGLKLAIQESEQKRKRA
jgi:probable addiction module antidote protein